jgi:hypothetical protein
LRGAGYRFAEFLAGVEVLAGKLLVVDVERGGHDALSVTGDAVSARSRDLGDEPVTA